MNRIVSMVVLVSALGLTGCATGARAYMDTALANRSEAATVWNRPQEVGFDWGAEITGEVSRTCILGVICWGYEDGSILDGVTGVLGSILGGGNGPKEVSDPLVRAAAAVAVSSTPKADGIFVVAHDTDSFNIFVYSHRTAHVRGKSFSLRPIGEVSQERADKVRNLRSINGALVNLPTP